MALSLENLKKKILAAKRQYAADHGYRLNPDKKILGMLIEKLAKNKKEKGAEYCPCRPLTGDPKEDQKKICPCFWHKKEIEKDGHCHCRLFYKK